MEPKDARNFCSSEWVSYNKFEISIHHYVKCPSLSSSIYWPSQKIKIMFHVYQIIYPFGLLITRWVQLMLSKMSPPHHDSMFLGLDVVGLFHHIPKAVTMKAMCRLLPEANVNHDELIKFFALLNCCWCPNYCQLKGKIFEFPDEVRISIGSLLGSLIAEVFMNTFEKNFFSPNHPLLSHIVIGTDTSMVSCACGVGLPMMQQTLYHFWTLYILPSILPSK